MTLPAKVIGGLAILLALTLVLYGRSTVIERDRNAVSIAALAGAKHEADSLRHVLVSANDSLSATVARVDTVWRIRVVTVSRADTIRLKADSLIVVATLGSADTAKVCQPILLAYQARTSECNLLRVAIQQDSAALGDARKGLESSGKALSSALGQVASLSARLGAVGKPYRCRILWLVPCPSRVVAFVVGGLAGGVLAWKAQH